MNLRRVAVLALVNVAAASAVMIHLALREQDWIRQESEEKLVAAARSQRESSSQQSLGEVRVSFGPCDFIDRTPREADPIIMGNLPVSVMTGWGNACPAKKTLAGILGVQEYWIAGQRNLKTERAFDGCVLAMIAAQWLVLGAIPTRSYAPWWREPGAFISICTAVGAVVVMTRHTLPLGRPVAAIAAIAWLVWLLIAVYAAVRKIWSGRRAAATNLS